MSPLYSITHLESQIQGEIKLEISLNADHEIFSAHFPGDPILPGVCMIQIVKESVQHFSQQNLSLKTARNIKFLAKVNPIEFPKVNMNLIIQKTATGDYQVNARTFYNELVFFKFSGLYSLD